MDQVSRGRSRHPFSFGAISRNLAWTIRIALRFLSPMTVSIFDKRAARYWQGLPLHRMSGVMLAFFFTFGGLAFLLDLYNWEGLRLWALLASAALIGTNVVAFFVILSRRRFKLAPLLALLAVTVVYVLGRLPHGSAIPVTSAAHNRMVLDATGILLGTFLGYRFFYGFISVEGVEQIRARTELELAHGIQRTLVPVTAIQIRNPSSKLCAESVAEVGCSLGHVGHESVSASGASVSQGHVFARDSRQNATGFVFRKADRSLVPRVSCLKCRCFVFVGSGAVGVFTIADPQAYLSTPERTDRRKPWTRSQ